MALSPVSLLLLRRIVIISKTPKPQLFLLPLKPYSTSTATDSPDPPKPTSLSARMSFVFDQIDAIERERSQKDETLQRIRAWRQSRDPQTTPEASTVQNTETVSSQDEKLEPGSGLVAHSGSDLSQGRSFQLEEKKTRRREVEVEVVHPWPEWIELMERLVQQNYFDHRRRDEDKMLQDSGFDVSGLGNDEDGKDVEIDFNDYRTVQLACLNFGKDRFDIFRSLSRHDIQNLVGYGCPSADKKVVFSSKLLRKHVHLDEGDVCSNCSLRSSCERAYLVTNKEDEARTIDVMRVLLAYGFDPINGSVSNKSLLKQKSVKSVVRKLLHQVVKLSAVPIDPNLPPPIIRKPPPKVKQPPPPPKKRVGRDDIEMKKGDWLCPKCDFMNFAKNTVCLQCDAKRPKRQLLPGEWECPECKFLNYRRNMTCFHCDCKRPPDEFMESKMEERKRDHRIKLEKNFSRTEASNPWNFDFDDNESDGADAEPFEYADAAAMADSPPPGSRTQDGNFKGRDNNLNRATRSAGVHDREFSDRDHAQLGFDDFDDEDDIESYELDTQNGNPPWKGSQNNVSELEDSSSEDVHDSSHNFHNRLRPRPSSSGKPPKPMSKRADFSGSEDAALGSGSDEEFGVHPKWKSSHVTDTKQRNTGKGQSRGLSFGSDEENGLDSDIDEDFPSIRRKSSGPGERRMPTHRRDDNFRSHNEYDFVRDGKVRLKGRMGNRRNKWDEETRLDSDMDGNSDEDFGSSRRKRSGSRGKRMSTHRRDVNFRGQDLDGFLRDAARRSRGGMGDRRNSCDDNFERSSSGSRWKNRVQGSNHPSRRIDEKDDDLQNFRGRNREGSRNWHRGTPHENNMDGDRHFGEFKNSRRVIER